MMRQEAKVASGTEQTAGRVEDGIEGGVHSMRLLCAHHSQGEDWGFHLIDARNSLNDDNQTKII